MYYTFSNTFRLTSANNSLFCNTLGETFTYISGQTVSPDFSQTPSQSPTLTNNSTISSTCGTSAQCVYDAYYTGSLDAAASTRALRARDSRPVDIERVVREQLLSVPRRAVRRDELQRPVERRLADDHRVPDGVHGQPRRHHEQHVQRAQLEL